MDEAPSGRLHVDGNFLVSAEAESLKERKRMAFAGHITVATVLAGGDRLGAVDVRAMGVPETDQFDLDDMLDALAEAAEDGFKRMGRKERQDEAAVEEAIRRAVRREASRIWGKKPHVEAIVLSA